jgi:hypothetical protein
MLEGYSPSRVVRLATYLAGYQVALLLIAALAMVFVLRDLPLRIEAVVFFLAAVITPGTLVWPALVLALRDRRATAELVQGQMVGASPVSMVYGLGMVYVNTRHQRFQLNVERRLLRSIPQSQVQVAARVTPNLRHVQSLQVIGPRFGPSVPAEVPERFRSVERFPVYAIAGTYGAVFGLGLILLLLPLPESLLALHLLLPLIGMAAMAFAARFVTQRAQKRLEATIQA